jgi:hypothetical protein
MTQWIGQFSVAAELVKRDYIVSLTLGNAPGVDILCKSPKEKNFSVQVKSLKSKGYFPFQDKFVQENIKGLYVVFVYIPKKLNEHPEYFVFSHREFRKVWQREQKVWAIKERKRGKKYKEWSNGIGYRSLVKNHGKNHWAVLPK